MEKMKQGIKIKLSEEEIHMVYNALLKVCHEKEIPEFEKGKGYPEREYEILRRKIGELVDFKTMDALNEKARTQLLSEKELDLVINRVKEFKQGDDELCILIVTLSWAFITKEDGKKPSTKRLSECRALMEKFLYYPEDPYVSCLALKALCNFWGYSGDYLTTIKEFIQGVNWGDFDLMISAISIAGEYLREEDQKDQELLKLLIDRFEEYQAGKGDPDIGEVAYRALARATGQEWNDFLSDEKPNLRILEKIKQMVKF